MVVLPDPDSPISAMTLPPGNLEAHVLDDRQLAAVVPHRIDAEAARLEDDVPVH